MNMNSNETNITLNASQTYRKEIGKAMTEFLFGDEENLDPIEFGDPKVKYYVVDRKPSAGKDIVQKYDAERQLFKKFWPPANYRQVLHIIGGQGSGKSTFTRYFFQYFLPHYETLVNSMDPSSDLCKIYAEALRRHILLYADLRHAPATDFRPYVFKKLGKSLDHVAKRLGFANDFRGDSDYVEDKVKYNISQLAKETEGKERKWYISWVFDNSDQLEMEQLLELTSIVLDLIPQEQSRIFPNDPVQNGQRRELWRVIIPIRPETWTNLEHKWAPFINRDSLDLDPIEHNILVKKRADFVFQTVSQSMKHHQPDPKRITKDRADWELVTPKEMAERLKADMLDVRLVSGDTRLISPEARNVLDQLVGESARRRLNLFRRVAFSRSFGSRKARGRREDWTAPVVTPFYFFDGLICGNDNVFDPRKCSILNLYNLGATQTSGAPYSIFVGIHAIYLLTLGKQWAEAKKDLAKIGYRDNDLNECEQWLVNKELIKDLLHGGYWIESSIVGGHWALLKERAYTDNMAVACARSWDFGDKVPETDPLDAEQLLCRFGGSLWFLKKIWESEKRLTVYSTDAFPHFKTLGEFNAFRKNLRLPSITHYVANEYLLRIQGLSGYWKPKRAIESDREQWQKNHQELKELVEESGKTEALDARQS